MFALAFYNKTTKQLILQERFKRHKTIIYGYLKDKLYFSSEIKSLLECAFERRICKSNIIL